MPRRHRSARERTLPDAAPKRPSNVAPEWATTEGMAVRAVSGRAAKAYRCPGCLQEIRARTPHLVVMREGDPAGRRHWHTPCWRRELRRLGRSG